MFGETTERTKRQRSIRRGLAPLELVLWLPVLLMVMALIVNYSNITSWRLRGEFVARDAIWRSRWPRSGNAEPRPPETVWPAHAGMGVRDDSQLWLNLEQIDHAVVRGPVLELGNPSRSFVVQPLLDQEVGAVRGFSDIVQRYDMLPSLGQYDSGEIADRMLTRHWQCAQMGFPNHFRRTQVLYELPRTDSRFPEAYVRSIFGLLAIPHHEALSVLDRDMDWMIYYGRYPDFYPRINPNYGETDPVAVYDRSVKPLVDHWNERGELELGHISLLPRTMTDAYLQMYEAVQQEIEDLEAELVGNAPPTGDRRRSIENRLAHLRQIQDLELKIEQLRSDLETIQTREDDMRFYVRSILTQGDGGG